MNLISQITHLFQTITVAQTIDHSDIVDVTTAVYSIEWGIVVAVNGSEVTVSYFNETACDWLRLTVDAREVELIVKGSEFFSDLETYYGAL